MPNEAAGPTTLPAIWRAIALVFLGKPRRVLGKGPVAGVVDAALDAVVDGVVDAAVDATLDGAADPPQPAANIMSAGMITVAVRIFRGFRPIEVLIKSPAISVSAITVVAISMTKK